MTERTQVVLKHWPLGPLIYNCFWFARWFFFFFLITLAHVIESRLKGDRYAWGQRHLNSIFSSWETIHHRPPLLPTSVGLWCSQEAEQQPLLQRFYISAVSTVVTKTYFRMISSLFSSLFYRLRYFRMGFCWCAGRLTLNAIIFGTARCKIVCYQCEQIQHSKRVWDIRFISVRHSGLSACVKNVYTQRRAFIFSNNLLICYFMICIDCQKCTKCFSQCCFSSCQCLLSWRGLFKTIISR